MAHPSKPSNCCLLAFVFGTVTAHLAICVTLGELTQILGTYGQLLAMLSPRGISGEWGAGGGHVIIA